MGNLNKCNFCYALRFVELTAQSRKLRTRVKNIIIKYFCYALFTLSLDSAPSISRRLFRLSRLITPCWKVIVVVAGAELRLVCVTPCASALLVYCSFLDSASACAFTTIRILVYSPSSVNKVSAYFIARLQFDSTCPAPYVAMTCGKINAASSAADGFGSPMVASIACTNLSLGGRPGLRVSSVMIFPLGLSCHCPICRDGCQRISPWGCDGGVNLPNAKPFHA